MREVKEGEMTRERAVVSDWLDWECENSISPGVGVGVGSCFLPHWKQHTKLLSPVTSALPAAKVSQIGQYQLP